jgi:hypothetical protein
MSESEKSPNTAAEEEQPKKKKVIGRDEELQHDKVVREECSCDSDALFL